MLPLRPDKCSACGRLWQIGDGLHISDFKTVCPTTKDCNQKKERARLLKAYGYRKAEGGK